MTEMIAVVDKGTEPIEKSVILSSAFMGIQFDGKMSLEVYGGSTIWDFFKNSSTFSCFPPSDSSRNSSNAGRVTWLGRIFPSPLAFRTSSHTTLHLNPPLKIEQQAIHIKARALN
jgi:hypothetical protein